MPEFPKCTKCTSTVYLHDRIDAYGTYHRGCFTCSAPECTVKLTLTTFKSFTQRLFCTKHYQQAIDRQSTIHLHSFDSASSIQDFYSVTARENSSIDSILESTP